MRPAEEINKLIKKLHLNASANLNKRISESISSAQVKPENKQAAYMSQNIWSNIMKKPITKLTAAAVIIIVAGILLYTNNSIIPTAYALQDTINAHNSIRYLHVKSFKTVYGQRWNSEIWIEYDEHAQPARFRLFTDRISTSDEIGPITLINDGDGSYTWVQNANLCFKRTGESLVTSLLLQWEISDVDPKLVFEKLLRQDIYKEIILDINQPDQKSEPIVLVVTYPPESRSANWKKVLYIDQATRLVKKEEKFEMRDGQYQHVQTTEFFDYDQHIESKMFDIKEELPKNVIMIDQSDKEVGLAQGNMTNEEIAAELSTQFLQAGIARDFNKLGQLYLGVPGFIIERFFGGNMLKIISVGPVHADSDPDSNKMMCASKSLYESGGQYYESNTEFQVTPVSGQPGRWMICGNNTNAKAVSGNTKEEK